MPESLLQVSNILLFGVVVDDLDVIGPPEEADEDAEKPKKGKKLPRFSHIIRNCDWPFTWLWWRFTQKARRVSFKKNWKRKSN